MKARILQALRFQEGSVSGGQLSAAIGISRVSIWKHIHKLQELGYQIEATPKGYELVGSPDALFAWEFPGRESRIVYYAEVGSTMDIAKALARKNCPDFTVVIAERQTRGRGRLSRKWISDSGGLFFTMVLRPPIPVLLSGRINFLAAVTLVRTLRETLQIDARVKWPNDILVAGRKIAGMLSELEAEGDRVRFINIGIGVNVNNDPSPIEAAAASLREITGTTVSRKALFAKFMDDFELQLRQADFDQIISEWKKYTVTLQRRVRIVTGREVSEGLAVDVDENGALIMQLADGSLKKIIYGDCFHPA
jgi:BirA family transcriptional regulator, biotin operon repressor / biotin---[acetyl-CoA-carboxylase] ligase